MTQAEYLIGRFGGISAMARSLGLSPTVVQGWKMRGHVPGKRLPTILQAGEGLSPPLEDSEFFRARGGEPHDSSTAAAA